MARVEPDPIFTGCRRLRLIARMACRHWVPSELECAMRAEQLAERPTLAQQERRAAAAFRWTLLQQRSVPAASEGPDDQR